MVELTLLQDFVASPAGLAAKGMLALAGLDFILGVWAAVKDGTFDAAKSGAVLVKHVMGRVVPIAALLGGGFVLQDAYLMSGGGAAAAIYVNETRRSLLDSIGQVFNPESKDTKENEVPEE